MEASILAAYPGVQLPERWRPGPGRDPVAPSLRRLVVLVRHLPDGSPLVEELHPPRPVEWSSLHQLVDDMRRTLLAVNGVKDPPPHAMSPENDAKGLSPSRVAVLRAAKARAEAHNNR